MIQIRTAQIQDAKELHRLNEEFNGTGESTVKNVMDSLENNNNEIVLIAVDVNKGVGFICAQVYSSICYTENSAQITELYVNKEYRNQHIASKLMDEMETILKSKNVYNVFLQTAQNNFNAQKFYEKSGYKLDDEITYVKKL